MEHFYQNIQGWFDFQDPYNHAVNTYDNAQFVEIGSWRGMSAAYMGVLIKNSGKNIKLTCVDKWEMTDEMKQVHPDIKIPLLDEFLKNVKPVIDVITPVKMASVEASKLYPNKYFDFIFIDGDHTYEGVKEDIEYWHPKLKDNGLIAGHDYMWSGVYEAVNEYFGKINIEVWHQSWIYKGKK